MVTVGVTFGLPRDQSQVLDWRRPELGPVGVVAQGDKCEECNGTTQT